MKKSTTKNRRDYISVALGIVHNVGAGGVRAYGNIDIDINQKRFRQYCIRTGRACGRSKEY